MYLKSEYSRETFKFRYYTHAKMGAGARVGAMERKLFSLLFYPIKVKQRK
jgi:hypothetical protein